MAGEEPPRPTVSAKQVARQATQAALLDAATRMLFEAPGKDRLLSLKPVDVVRRADPARTTGAFYNIWPTHADFRRDLLAHLLSLERFRVDAATRDLLAQALAQEEFDLAETVRLAANMNFDGLKEEPAFVIQHALWTDHAANDEVRERLRGLYVAISDSLVPLYEAVLARSGRRMCAPHTTYSLSVVLAALVEGLHVRWAVDPDAVPDNSGPPPGVEVRRGEDGSEQPWSLFATMVYVLLMSMSEPS
jgi:hypothetical protein